MRKSGLILMLLCCVAMWSVSNESLAYNINDVGSQYTAVRQGQSNSSSTGSWVDTIPDPTPYFQIYGIDYAITGSSMNVKIYSDMPQTGVQVGSYTAQVGVFGLDVDLNGTFDYGLSLADGQLKSVTSWKTSSDVWETRNGYIYGETWINPYKGNESPIVGINTGTEIAGASNFAYANYGVSGIDYLISFDLDLGKLAGWNGGNLGLFVAASDCANDIAYGQAQVPIPAAAWLLGTGLIGLVGIRRKFK